MPSWDRRACQRKTPICAITCLVLVVGQLISVAVYLSLRWQVVGESSTQDVTYDLSDNMSDDCTSKATVVTDKAIMQRWEACSANFSQALNNGEQNVREPADKYMEKRHALALYMYTDIMTQSVNQDFKSAERTGKRRETFEPRSLYSSLSEAIQIVKHSQVTCLSTNYRAETLLHLNLSNKQVRFSTFVLGSDEGNFAGNVSCFEVYSCFGADVTHYSALKMNNLVLIPPYELFKVTDIKTEAKRCKVLYRLRSNLNCVYDTESNMLHPISALPMEGLWLIFTIICIIIVCLVLSFVIVKVYHKKTAVYSASFFHDSTAITS